MCRTKIGCQENADRTAPGIQTKARLDGPLATPSSTKSGGHLGWRQNLSLKSLRLIRCAFYRTLLRRKHLRRSARRWLAISFSQTTSGAPLWSAQCLVLLSSLWRHTAPRSLNCVPLKEGPVDTRCALFYTAITCKYRAITFEPFAKTSQNVNVRVSVNTGLSVITGVDVQDHWGHLWSLGYLRYHRVTVITVIIG